MGIQKLTNDQAVIISGFTGILCGEFSDFHADVEKRLGRGVQTFELADKKFWNETVKPLYASDFIEMGTIDLNAAKAQVPEGFVLVPKEPTLKMVRAAEHIKSSNTIRQDIYKAMIEAWEQKG